MHDINPFFNRMGEENAFAVLARATQLAAEGRDIINLGIGQPDFATPAHIVEAAVKALRDGAHGYTPANGLLATREAVSRRIHALTGADVSPESIMITPGGKPAMFAAILMFGAPGAEILYPDPGFPIYRSMIEATGATPVPVPMRAENGFAVSADEVASLITDRTRLLIVNSPGNPTGGVTPVIDFGKSSAPDNGEGGWIKGLELSISAPFDIFHPALEGFGAQFSASTTDSEVLPDPTQPPTALPGLPENVINTEIEARKSGIQSQLEGAGIVGPMITYLLPILIAIPVLIGAGALLMRKQEA